MVEERTLYLSHLHERITKELLEELFIQIGPIESVIVHQATHRFAFIQFYDEESIQFAIEMMNGLVLYGVPISVKPRANTLQERICIENKPFSSDSQKPPLERGHPQNNYPSTPVTHLPHRS